MMRQQALAEAAEGRGQGGEKVPTTAAEALLLAAERQGSGSPVRACQSVLDKCHKGTAVTKDQQCCWPPSGRALAARCAPVSPLANGSHTRATL